MLEVPIKIDLPQGAEENELQPKDYSSFDNYSKKRVKIIKESDFFSSIKE